MGTTGSKDGRGDGGNKHNGGPGPTMVGQAVAVKFPPQQPYSGTPIHYHYMIINVTLDIKIIFSVSFNSTNLESYYPQLASMYQQGYRMLVFVSLPGQTKSYASGKSRITAKFEGIFRKLFPEELGEQWELKVEKSMLVNQMFAHWKESGSDSDNFHIVQTIDRISGQGGRLVNVEMTGMAGQELQMRQKSLTQVSVDVFYELPLHPSSERYVYQLVSCPMQSSLKHYKYSSVMDWQGVMTKYLGSGWKLVEIFEDHSESTTCHYHGFTADVTKTKNCLWIFEKPASRMNDSSPFYEGTMVEHYFETKSEAHGLFGHETNVTTDWEPVIEYMGNYGWQVVRILSTPDTITSGTFKVSVSTRQLIFFQRKIAGRNEPQSGAVSPLAGLASPTEPEVAPPAYDDLYNNQGKQ